MEDASFFSVKSRRSPICSRYGPPPGGMYIWADFGRDTNELAASGSREGVLCAPGSLFSPTQLPSTWMRVAAATCLNDAAMKFLARTMAR
jgi:DNA-binding transcriptional MocR family regulator